MFNLQELDTKIIEESVIQHHKIYDYPIKDTSAENIIARFIRTSGMHVEWVQGGHQPGCDVFVKNNDILIAGYSVKAGKEPQNGKWLAISSYRTTKHPALEDKKNSIREIDKKITKIISFSRVESKIKKEPHIDITYKVYIIDPILLDIDSFNFHMLDNGNFKGTNQFGVDAEIRKKMSDQLWYYVPLDIIRKSDMVYKLCEIGNLRMALWN